MRRNRIRLSEGQLRRVIKESVYRILNEENDAIPERQAKSLGFEPAYKCGDTESWEKDGNFMHVIPDMRKRKQERWDKESKDKYLYDYRDADGRSFGNKRLNPKYGKDMDSWYENGGGWNQPYTFRPYIDWEEDY